MTRLYDTDGEGVGPACKRCGQPADWHDATTGACSDDDGPHYSSEAAEEAREQTALELA